MLGIPAAASVLRTEAKTAALLNGADDDLKRGRYGEQEDSNNTYRG